MKHLILIAAIGKNDELGKNNELIWYLKEDLKFFKNQTMGHDIIMGYQTFCSLPKVLPGRKHIVLTHREIEFPEGVVSLHSKEEVLDYICAKRKDCYVIGGASIYNQFIDEADKMYLTQIDAEEKEADAYFPKFEKEEWKVKPLDDKEENGIHYKHLEYVRK